MSENKTVNIREKLEEKQELLKKIREAKWLDHKEYYKRYKFRDWEEGPAKPGDKSGYGLNPQFCMHYGNNLARFERFDLGCWDAVINCGKSESETFRGSKDGSSASQRAQEWCNEQIDKCIERLEEDIRALKKKVTVPQNMECVKVPIEDINHFYDDVQASNGKVEKRDGPEGGVYIVHVALPEDESLLDDWSIILGSPKGIPER